MSKKKIALNVVGILKKSLTTLLPDIKFSVNERLYSSGGHGWGVDVISDLGLFDERREFLNNLLNRAGQKYNILILELNVK